jgi:hypothetical protein
MGFGPLNLPGVWGRAHQGDQVGEIPHFDCEGKFIQYSQQENADIMTSDASREVNRERQIIGRNDTGYVCGQGL